MTRTFWHDFHPPHLNPLHGRDVELTVQEIEDAGLREILQTPGAALGSWSMLESLLQPTGDDTPFAFRQPLGEAREVKVALSGLFGRFVARAYLARFFGLSIFAHLGQSTIVLDDRRQIQIVPCKEGDLPDWIACSSTLRDLTVAEAKGSHAQSGPAQALGRAWKQAGRIRVEASGRPVRLRRIAVATRWGVGMGGPPDPWISVRDPIDEGDTIEQSEEDAIYVGLFRHHVANMITKIGHLELATAIRDLTAPNVHRDDPGGARRDESAREILDRAPRAEFGHDAQHLSLVGGTVTRVGPLPESSVSPADLEVLARLDLRPVFVGIEHKLLDAAIMGVGSIIREALADRPSAMGGARSDQAGCWIVPLGDEDDDEFPHFERR